jgi:phage-related protein
MVYKKVFEKYFSKTFLVIHSFYKKNIACMKYKSDNCCMW